MSAGETKTVPQPDLPGAPESGLSPVYRPAALDFLELVRRELARATLKFPRPQTGLHEGYAVLLEEVDELWDEIKGQQDPHNLLIESVQVAAMAARLVRDRGLIFALEMPAGDGTTNGSANLLAALERAPDEPEAMRWLWSKLSGLVSGLGDVRFDVPEEHIEPLRKFADAAWNRRSAAPQLLDSLLAVEWAGSVLDDVCGDELDCCPNCFAVIGDAEIEGSGLHTPDCELRDSLDAALGVTTPRAEVAHG